MKLAKFVYDLPPNLIAQFPTKEREDARLLVVDRKTGAMEDRLFRDLVDYFDDKDVFVVNNTKVFPSRLYGKKEKTGAKIEVFLLRELNKSGFLWDVIVDPARKIRVGNKLYFDDYEYLVAEVIDNTTSRGRTIKFLWNKSYEEFRSLLDEIGQMPIPKYIKRTQTTEDVERYQTLFAKYEGAVALPASGANFSKRLIKQCEIIGIKFAELTLHPGIATFKPLEVEDITKHKMDAEYVHISQDTCNIINKAKERGKRVCSIGTTTMRALESSYTAEKFVKPIEGWTNKFIYPKYDFNIADSMITNFNYPKTTTYILTTAFIGYELCLEVYQKAIKDKYRFLCYGDSMLIL